MSRPFLLDPLFQPLSALSGIGPKSANLIEKLVGGPKVLDLLWHTPIDLIDRSLTDDLSKLKQGQYGSVQVIIDKHFPPERKNSPYRIWCRHETGTINLVYFKAGKAWMEKEFPVGAEFIISGKIEFYNDTPQIVHPDIILTLKQKDKLPHFEPVYPLTTGITNKTIKKSIKAALKFCPNMLEWHDPQLLKNRKWNSFNHSIHHTHTPQSTADIEPENASRQRLAYDEILANQLTLALVRQDQKRKKGRSFDTANDMRMRVIGTLPYTLTGAQERSLNEIDVDMKTPTRMMRLLQGDVGSGKTIVAALSMLNAVANGAQAAIMAPTEILARQHEANFKDVLKPLGLNIVTLTGRNKGAEREELLTQISDGYAQIVIGTHALFQDSVAFHNLGIAVIDEQHRFGVQQRLRLSDKTKAVDVLVMTATPIPRTLTMTAYGDMDVSQLNEKPTGRKPVQTLLASKDKVEDLIEGLKRRVTDGARVYWVCPLVEESMVMNLISAEERFEGLQYHFERIGLIHGRMKPHEKDAVMKQFSSGNLDILVSTTVIEVGVNVPEATVMVIEHAERFGLAQLHQLRGRVGRGGDQSYCFLLYDTPISETGKERLKIMRESEDGFLIAEKDLELRGAGDILGTKQSGLPKFKIADLEFHKDLLQIASNDAKLILDKDPDLQSDRGQALRTLLYLMERDEGVKYLKGG